MTWIMVQVLRIAARAAVMTYWDSERGSEIEQYAQLAEYVLFETAEELEQST